MTYATCSCGSAWFRAQITLDDDGMPAGYTGPATCIDCSVAWTPPHKRLSLVGAQSAPSDAQNGSCDDD